jgi:predicted nuclease with TOPRIM domain
MTDLHKRANAAIDYLSEQEGEFEEVIETIDDLIDELNILEDSIKELEEANTELASYLHDARNPDHEDKLNLLDDWLYDDSILAEVDGEHLFENCLNSYRDLTPTLFRYTLSKIGMQSDRAAELKAVLDEFIINF